MTRWGRSGGFVRAFVGGGGPHCEIRLKESADGSRWSRPEEFALSGAETEASWQRMIDRLRPPPSDTERRMAEIERELNRLGLD